jgi:hypothetical protein
MDRFEIESKKLERVVIKIAILQILALVITCFVGMYMSHKGLFYLVVSYGIVMIGIIRLKKKWLTKIDPKKNE